MLDVTDVPDHETECECGHVGSFHYEGGCRGAVSNGAKDESGRPQSRRNCSCKGFKEKA